MIYFSFIRPVLEYGDVIWDNLSQGLKDQLDKIQNKAARITTGCTKLVAIADLYREVGLETLSQRRRKHKLILFYKMVNWLAQNYRNHLVPTTVGNSSAYNLRRPNNNLGPVNAERVSIVIPAVINEWNNLPDEIKNAESLSSFNFRLNGDKPVPRKLYFF